MPRPRPRVLVIAEAANPLWQSVPLVGWAHYKALSEVVDAHLITQVRNREAILREGLVEGVDFTAIDSESLARPFHRLGEVLRGGKGKGWTTLAALGMLPYYYFEHLLWKRFGERIEAGEFDLVHRLTPLSPTTPSILAGRCRRAGTPFVLGPLNGGLPWPAGYEGVRIAEREWLSYVRRAYRLMPGHRSTYRDASAIIVASKATWRQMPESCRNRCVYIPENGIDLDRFPRLPNPRRSTTPSPIRLVFVGRLVPYKGADVALTAAAPFLRDGSMTFDVVGDGPQGPALHRLAEGLGVSSRVVFHGAVEHSRVMSIFGESDVLVFPSIREFGGAVVLEAMAAGVVPMVVDYGGPAELATPQTGFLAPLADRERLTKTFGGFLEGIREDPSLIGLYSDAAQRRARDNFTWDVKAAQVTEVYRWVLDGARDRPRFAMPARDAVPAAPLAV